MIKIMVAIKSFIDWCIAKEEYNETTKRMIMNYSYDHKRDLLADKPKISDSEERALRCAYCVLDIEINGKASIYYPAFKKGYLDKYLSPNCFCRIRNKLNEDI